MTKLPDEIPDPLRTEELPIGVVAALLEISTWTAEALVDSGAITPDVEGIFLYADQTADEGLRARIRAFMVSGSRSWFSGIGSALDLRVEEFAAAVGMTSNDVDVMVKSGYLVVALEQQIVPLEAQLDWIAGLPEDESRIRLNRYVRWLAANLSNWGSRRAAIEQFLIRWARNKVLMTNETRDAILLAIGSPGGN